MTGFERFGERLRRARKDAGLSQLQLAMRVDTTQATISEYERGLMEVKKPDIRLLVRISDELKISLEWLITGRKPK